MIVPVPNTAGRYYLAPILGMWTDVFASPGCGSTGTQPENVLLTTPIWGGEIPIENGANECANANRG